MSTQSSEIPEEFDVAAKTALSQSVKHSISAVTGNPIVGEVVGQLASNGYPLIPGHVRTCAAWGGILVAYMAGKSMLLGTAGSMAFGVSMVPFIPVAMAGGAVVGGMAWLFSDKEPLPDAEDEFQTAARLGDEGSSQKMTSADELRPDSSAGGEVFGVKNDGHEAFVTINEVATADRPFAAGVQYFVAASSLTGMTPQKFNIRAETACGIDLR